LIKQETEAERVACVAWGHVVAWTHQWAHALAALNVSKTKLEELQARKEQDSRAAEQAVEAAVPIERALAARLKDLEAQLKAAQLQRVQQKEHYKHFSAVFTQRRQNLDTELETLYGEQHAALGVAYENFHNDVSSAQVNIKKKERSLGNAKDDLEDAMSPAMWEGQEAIDQLKKSVKSHERRLKELTSDLEKGSAFKARASASLEKVLEHAAHLVGAHSGLPKTAEGQVQWHAEPGDGVVPAKFSLMVGGEAVEVSHPQHQCDLNLAKRQCRKSRQEIQRREHELVELEKEGNAHQEMVTKLEAYLALPPPCTPR